MTVHGSPRYAEPSAARNPLLPQVGAIDDPAPSTSSIRTYAVASGASASSIWRAFEREVKAASSAVRFIRARRRRAALASYPSLADAVVTMTPSGETHRDAIVAALLAEYAETRTSVWAAALALSMKPMLVGLIENLRRHANAAEVIAHFLESATSLRSTRRITLRLYSETRRSVLRPVREARADAAIFDHAIDVDEIEPFRASAIEDHLDQARFVRRAMTAPRMSAERLDAYAERVRRIRDPKERRALWRALRFQNPKLAEDLTLLCARVTAVA